MAPSEKMHHNLDEASTLRWLSWLQYPDLEHACSFHIPGEGIFIFGQTSHSPTVG